MGKRENCAGQASLVICQTEKLVNHESSWIISLNLLKARLNNLYRYLNEVCRPGIGPWHKWETSDLKRLWKSQFSRSIVDIHNVPIQEASLRDYSINGIFNRIVRGQSVARHPGEWASERMQRLILTQRCNKSNTSANELKPWLRASERMQKERKNASQKKALMGYKKNFPWSKEKIDYRREAKRKLITPCGTNCRVGGMKLILAMRQRQIDYHREAKRNWYCREAWIAVRWNEIDSCREAKKNWLSPWGEEKIDIAMRRESPCGRNEIGSCCEAKKNWLSPWGEEKIDNAVMGRESL
jgi:hypothetical protein